MYYSYFYCYLLYNDPKDAFDYQHRIKYERNASNALLMIGLTNRDSAEKVKKKIQNSS
jgi:hypothetical protein